MTEAMLLNFLGISLVSGLLAVLLLLVKRHVKIASKWVCICWAVLALRLLIPYNLPISLINAEYHSVVSEISAAADMGESVTEAEENSQTAVGAEKTGAVNVLGLITAVWLTVAVGLMMWQVTAYFLQRKNLLRWSRIADEETEKAAMNTAEKIGLKRSFRVYICESETSPLLMGVFRPVLLLPTGLSDKQLEIALRHELAHLKRNDILFKTLIIVAKCVHWFNPLVHIMAKNAEKDAEAACDEAVLSGADRGERRAYCETILDMMHGRYIPFATALTYKKETGYEKSMKK